MLESKFKSKLKKELEARLPGCIILPGDATSIQGIPDLLVLHNQHWAALEGKQNEKSSKQPNQEYYVDKMNKMSFASFICPENMEEVLSDLQHTFSTGRSTRIS